ncbi:fructosamine kinase family protein [Salinigranum marinum]|uniref:fructosamine kinase family protein n=1 Tax=Salinigranum marinum TaxID=1515595 RepID=UPI00298A01EF|nr:fructosamine kinase family protein [Salinigranum marinum]
MTDADSETAVGRRVADVFDATVTGVTELDGGMVGTVYRVAFAARDPVVAKTGPTPLDVEARMLRYLARYSSLPVPAVAYADADLLVLAFVAGSSTTTPAVERDAATRLAALHDRTAGAFGFPFDTLTGPLAQPNPWTASWIDFFREHRLRHVSDLARVAGTLAPDTHDRLDRVAADLADLLTEPARPALLHGDVWTENVLSSDGRVRAFLDPACYYGHPEVELASVAWTDTFDAAFFERYRAMRGIDPGFADRERVYRLFPLVVHVHLFGGGYRERLDRSLAALGY